MAKRDYYEILGVAKTATEDEIKKSYRKLAMQYHPDKNPGDKASEDTFKELAEAYKVLSDTDTRTKYDKFGHGMDAKQSHPGTDPFDMFNSMFQKNRPIKGSNIIINLNLTLEEMYYGVTKNVKYQKNVVCHTCHGVGGEDKLTCSSCNGIGVIRREIKSIGGSFFIQDVCLACNGVGYNVTKLCSTCNGTCMVTNEITMETVIPVGVGEGMSIVSFKGGNSIRGGENGDLVINLMQIPHQKFVRQGNDLKMHLKLRYDQLVLGDKIDVETIDGGKIRITIPELTKPTTILKVPKKGMSLYRPDAPSVESAYGDLLITFELLIPEKITDTEKKLITKLKKLY